MSSVKQKPYKIFTPIRDFLSSSYATGVILIGCTALSLLLSNISVTQGYLNFWHYSIPHTIGSINLPENPLSLVNDVLMTFFFFLVGLEIKRELQVGELASLKRSMLPVIAAFGGMVCPAIIFAIFNVNTPYQHGWGIPMATDIAFSLGVLSLLGKKVPVQLKIFLMALAIIDDLGAVVTIAIFYTKSLNLIYFGIAALAVVTVMLFNKFKVKNPYLYLLPAVVLWYSLFNSGIHPTISGVIMAFSMPLIKLEKIEHMHKIPVNYIIMPLFALANTAIILPSNFNGAFTSTISYGIILGLVIGKPVGIFSFSWAATKLGIAALPSKSTYKQLLGMGILGGIGFTMSIFTSTLSYNSDSLQIISKISIIAASFVSGVVGYMYVARFKPATVEHTREAEIDNTGLTEESVLVA
ncbi:MAG TPA: Na+/H+ antiporter NhaA [Chitinophagaceae bacterium]|nr:Na+/H+ antiporter NhaA [Chitinophagaceae bacterium]